MDQARGGTHRSPARPLARGVGEGEELAPGPGTVGELVHFDGSVTRIDGGGHCVLTQVAAFDESPYIVVRLLDGRIWNRAVPAREGPSRYELRLSGAVASARDAVFAAIRRADGTGLVAVVEGEVELQTSASAPPVVVGPSRVVAVTAGGEVGPPRSLAASGGAFDPWLAVNRELEGPSGDTAAARPEPSPPPGPTPPAPVEPSTRAAPEDGIRTRSGDGASQVAVASPPAPPRPAVSTRTPPARTATPNRTPPAAPARPARPAPVEPLPDRRVRRPHWFTGARLTVLVAVVIMASLAIAYRQPATVTVMVAGREVRLNRSDATVADALRAADVTPPDGALLSAVTHRVLDRSFTPAKLSVDGRPARRSTALRAGARVEMAPGVDVVEPTARREAAAPPPPLPDVEYSLWYPGIPGREEQVYGAVSGEVVARRELVPPRPPRPEQGNVVALTFDDGPDPRWTPKVLDILRAEGVKATFCVVGVVGRKHVDLVRVERDQGHTMCNHTEHHVDHLDRAPTSKVVEEIDDGFRFLDSSLGAPPPLFRPPGGHVGPVVVDVAHERDMRVLNWNVDARDFDELPAPAMLASVLGAVRPGSVILLHDGGGDRSQTVALLGPLIKELKARGYGFATPATPPP